MGKKKPFIFSTLIEDNLLTLLSGRNSYNNKNCMVYKLNKNSPIEKKNNENIIMLEERFKKKKI